MYIFAKVIGINNYHYL